MSNPVVAKTDFEINSDGFLLPVLPLRDVVVYPNMVLPLFVGRQRSIEALDIAMSGSLEHEKKILLVAQKNPSVDEPSDQDLFSVGTVAQILQMLKLPDGTVKVLIEGQTRAQVTEMKDVVTHLIARVQDIPPIFVDEREADVLSRSLGSQFEQYVKFSKKVPPEILTSVMGLEDASLLVDTIATHLPLKMDEKQKILEILDVRERIEYVLGLLESEIDLLQIEKRIRGRVKKQMEKSQREYYLNEQLKAIQKELGDLDESRNEVDILEKRVKESGMSKEALTKATAEITKLRMMSPMSAEATVVRGYIEWLVNLPWKKKTRLHYDMVESQNLLDNEHYGLKEVKERILEYLAVQARVKKIKGPVLCLVGPPGVGKTSLAQSIARATHRQYARIALGGVRDEAEIRGHRRTYIGSMPGKIVQKLAKVGVRNPLILLDEIDKMSSDMRGDPASALLEVLDPEQNEAFGDHYLEVDYDLSDVMFICTANSMNIPAPLLDRMEIIRIPGYTEDEKLAISKQYLIPKQIKRNGVRDDELTFDELAIRDLIRYYTKEAGVRSLEREIAKVARKTVKESAFNPEQNKHIHITPELLEHYCGVRKCHYGRAEKEDRVGQVTGLAWTSVGGDLLVIEAAALPGKGNQVRTGSLGDVMKESIQAALTVVRSRSRAWGIASDFYDKTDFHIHVPEGATPKDGPSAGVGMCTAFVSVLTGIPVRSSVAMTGEITLRGQVLPIGGLKEKLLAAHRGGIETVIIPKENERDLAEIPDNIKEALDIRCVEWIEQVLEIALQRYPQPLLVDEESESIKDNAPLSGVVLDTGKASPTIPH